MSRAITTMVYTYDELSDAAKATAREWFKRTEGECWSSDRAPDLYEDMATCLGFLGIEVGKRDVNCVSVKGKTFNRQEWDFEWSGFWSQGDGLVLRGTWAAERVDLAKLQEHAPQDTVLHQLGAEFTALMLRCPTGNANILTVSYGPGLPGLMLDNGRVDSEGQIPMALEDVLTLKRLIERACTWCYRQLESNYEYDTGDEAVEEGIRSNEYEFTEEGERV